MTARVVAIALATLAVALVACDDDGSSEPTATAAAEAAIDTSAWPTYESEALGFTMKYPPTWVVEMFPSPEGTAVNTIWLMDPTYAQARDEALAANEGLPSEFTPPSGSSKIEIAVPLVNQPFDSGYFSEFCETRTETPHGTTSPSARITSVSGRQAVVCEVQWVLGEIVPITQWVDPGNGDTLRLTAGLVEPSVEGIRFATAILSSLSFDGTP